MYIHLSTQSLDVTSTYRSVLAHLSLRALPILFTPFSYRH